jgi:hypothetical protein
MAVQYVGGSPPIRTTPVSEISRLPTTRPEPRKIRSCEISRRTARTRGFDGRKDHSRYFGNPVSRCQCTGFCLGLPNRILNPTIGPQTLISLSQYFGWDKLNPAPPRVSKYGAVLQLGWTKLRRTQRSNAPYFVYGPLGIAVKDRVTVRSVLPRRIQGPLILPMCHRSEGNPHQGVMERILFVIVAYESIENKRNVDGEPR